jgi:NADPH:quinone reductase-like Zn-dependent oxidoreductase
MQHVLAALDRRLLSHGGAILPTWKAVRRLLAEYALLDEQAAVHAPKNLTDVEAATLPCAAVTAWHALVTLQFARASGARVIVTSSSEAKLERAKALGAFAGVNCRRNAEWSDAVLELTEGRGVDHSIEVGGPQSFAQSLNACARRGQINVIGYLGGKERRRQSA